MFPGMFNEKTNAWVVDSEPFTLAKYQVIMFLENFKQTYLENDTQ